MFVLPPRLVQQWIEFRRSLPGDHGEWVDHCLQDLHWIGHEAGNDLRIMVYGR